MRNFAVTLDLGPAECCCHRRDLCDVLYVFWLRNGPQALSYTVAKTYPTAWLVDQLFSTRPNDLRAEAFAAMALVLTEVEQALSRIEAGQRLEPDTPRTATIEVRPNERRTATKPGQLSMF